MTRAFWGAAIGWALALLAAPDARANAGFEAERYKRTVHAIIATNIVERGKGYLISGRTETVVFFSVDRAGKLLSVSILKNSGPPPFATVAVGIVRRASKWFPAMPEAVRADRMNFTIPITFSGR